MATDDRFVVRFSITNDETHRWPRKRRIPVLQPLHFAYPAGGETATTQMGDTSYGQHGKPEANPSNPPARTPNTSFTFTADPGNPWRAVARAISPGTRPRTGTGESQLEVVESDMPILAHRIAKLRFAGDGEHWGAVNKGTTFGVDAEAVCRGMAPGVAMFSAAYYGFSDELINSKPHKSPAVDCTCGFYATPLGKPSYSNDRCYVRLLVELAGDVIECEYLYRAQHQRVVECQLPRCMFCGKPSEVIVVRDGAMHNCACSKRHLERKKGLHLDIDELETLLPVPVTAMDPPS